MELEITQPRNDFDHEAAILCEAILQRIAKEEAATPLAAPDEEATDLIRRVTELIQLASLLTRWDMAIAAFGGPGSSMASRKATAIASRANKLRGFAAVRARIGDDQSALRVQWERRLADVLDRSIQQTEEVAWLIRAATFRRITRAECVTECVRVMPAAFNVPEETPQSVIDFCLEHGLTEELLSMSNLVKESFPEATHLRTEVIDDPEGEGSWVTLAVRVPKAGAHESYRGFVSRMVAEIPTPARGFLRFRPDLAA